MRAWPSALPMVALSSGGIGKEAGPSLLAAPARILQLDAHQDVTAWRNFAEACELTRPIARNNQSDAVQKGRQIAPGWVYQLSFELGEVLEPAIRRTAGHPKRGLQVWPLATAFRVEKDQIAEFAAGERPPSEPLDLRMGVAHDEARAAYEHAVERCLAYIAAGDVYQVNLAHVLRGELCAGNLQLANSRALACGLFAGASPWFGAHLELADGSTISSASPELFLRYDATSRRLITRPMKGTRPLAARKLMELASSAKDRAELAMIVDLMRNDLGRVCELGSMRVDTPHAIETHGNATSGLLQATATVSGTPREGATWADVIEACFPPGSVTGAPKVRATQIIRELEPDLRGPYCGCIGFVSDAGDSAWSVAIRTACVRDGKLSWHVGAGIVADSEPRAEWEETLAKAGALRGAGKSYR